jgi:hypothetical protein
MSSPFEPRGRPSRRIGGHRGKKRHPRCPGSISNRARHGATNRAASMLDGLDGRYLGPVNVRSSSRGCGQLKVLDCAMVWMLVRHASPRLPAPCAMTRGIVCSRIVPPSRTLAPGSNAKRVVAAEGNGKVAITRSPPAMGPPQGGLGAARNEHGCSSVPARGRRMLGENMGCVFVLIGQYE